MIADCVLQMLGWQEAKYQYSYAPLLTFAHPSVLHIRLPHLCTFVCPVHS